MTLHPYRHIAGLTLLALLLAVTFFAGIAVGITFAAPRSASLPSASPLVDERLIGAPSAGRYPVRRAVRESAVGWHPYPDPVPGGAPPTEAWTQSGIMSWMPERYGPDYLALPIGPGHRVELCSVGGCIVMVSTDAGPSLAMQRANRVADLAVVAWESISGVDRRYGLAPVTWVLVPQSVAATVTTLASPLASPRRNP